MCTFRQFRNVCKITLQYTCMYVCMHACMYVFIHVHMRGRQEETQRMLPQLSLNCTRILIYLPIYVYTYIYIYIYIYMFCFHSHVHTHTYTYRHMTTFTTLQAHSYMHTYVHTYIHTYIFKQEDHKSAHRFRWFPFLAGPRMCIGWKFSLNEAAAILAGIMQVSGCFPYFLLFAQRR
jgi:hypothetical protein